MLSNYFYLIPLVMSFILLILLLWKKRNKYKLKSLGSLSQRGWWGKIVFLFEVYIVPPKNSIIYTFYNELLKYTKVTVAEFIIIKLGLVLMGVIIIVFIYLTNIAIYTNEIMTKYDFLGDEFYSYKSQSVDQVIALEEEIHYLHKSLGIITNKESRSLTKEEIQLRILQLIQEAEKEFQVPDLTMANKVYYRLYHYYEVRKYNYPYLLLSLLLVYFLPDLFLKVYNNFVLANAKRELRLLKRLIILNGSIQPVNFLEVLELLIDKSKYHRKFLKQIEHNNKKNSINNSTIYRKYIEKEKDIDVKLFLEKLDQANNYDFHQAIINIENEFNIEKRQQIRNVKRQIELINIWGIVGCFLLIGLLTMYLLIPWLTAYNMNQIF